MIQFKIIDPEGGVTDIDVTRAEAWNVVHHLLGELQGMDDADENFQGYMRGEGPYDEG